MLGRIPEASSQSAVARYEQWIAELEPERLVMAERPETRARPRKDLWEDDRTHPRCALRTSRAVQDILIAVVDGLKGFPETMVQTCIVHLIRHSMTFCSWNDRKAVAAD